MIEVRIYDPSNGKPILVKSVSVNFDDWQMTKSVSASVMQIIDEAAGLEDGQ